jgi:PhnB protein
MAKAKYPIPEGLNTVTPMLALNDAAATIAWYRTAFGAEEVSRHAGPDGKVMHAELRIGTSRVMVHDAMCPAPAAAGSTASFWLYVEDCDALFRQAVDAGAKVPPGPMGDIADQFWGDRCGTVVDPSGYTWVIATRKEDLSTAELLERQAAFMKRFAAQTASA